MSMTTDELLTVLQGIKDGKKWEFSHTGLNYTDPYQEEDPANLIQRGYHIRIKPWSMPEPPNGIRWHRYDFTEEDLPDGWRPLLIGELHQEGDEVTNKECISGWEKADGLLNEPPDPDWHSRTRRPLPQTLPVEPEYVPLGPEDVPPGSVFRQAHWNPGVSRDRLSVLGNGVLTAVSGESVPYLSILKWDELYAGWQILRPGTTEWVPCRKLKGGVK